MEHYSNAVLCLSRFLEAELRSPVQVNLYQTPAGGQGLGSHLDDHDVLVLQLEGEKEWQISAPESASISTLSPPAAESEGGQTAVLRAGDWLYLPRGVRHEAHNSGPEPSAHLTIGFHPLTWGAILERALVKARAESRLLNEPVGADPERVEAESPADRLRELLSFIDLQAEVEQHRRVFRALGEPLRPPQCLDRGALDAADADTFFAWRTGAVSLTRTTNGLELDLSYRRAPLALHLDVRAIDPADVERVGLLPARSRGRGPRGGDVAGSLPRRRRRSRPHSTLTTGRAHSRSPRDSNRRTWAPPVKIVSPAQSQA